MNKNIFQIPVEDIKRSLQDAVNIASQKYNVTLSDLQKMYFEDPEAFKAFKAEAELYSNKIQTLYDTIIGAKNIFDNFDTNFKKFCKQTLFDTFDSVDVVKAEDGSILYSIGKTVKTIKEVNIEALKEVCGVNVGATIEKLPELWTKAFVRAKYSQDKLVDSVEAAIQSGRIPSCTATGVALIKITNVVDTKIIYPGDVAYVNGEEVK